MTGTSSIGKTGNNCFDDLLYGAERASLITFSFPDAVSDYESGYANGVAADQLRPGLHR